MSSQWAQVAGTAGTDGPPLAGPSASSHTAVLHSGVGLAPPKLLPGGNSKPVLGPGPPRRQPSGLRDAAGAEESGGWGGLKSVGGGQSTGHPRLGLEQGFPPSGPSWPFSGPDPTALFFSSSEHLRGLYPGQDSPRGGPPGKRREGRPGHPWRARPRQLCPGRRRGRGAWGCPGAR